MAERSVQTSGLALGLQDPAALEALDILEKQVPINEDYLSMVHLNLANVYDEIGEKVLSDEHQNFFASMK